MNTQGETEWLSVPEVGELLDIPLRDVRDMIRAHDLVATRRAETNAVIVHREELIERDGRWIVLPSLRGTVTVLKDAGLTDDVQVDIVSSDTGAVKQGDGILYSLANHCARQPGFLSTDAPLVDTLFKVFVTNDNKPLSSEELSKIVGKPAETILKTIGGFNVYKGIRPAS